MILDLVAIPANANQGIYPLINGMPNRTDAGRLPERMMYLHPSALASFLSLGVRCSDILRSASGSLHAIQEGRGAMPPGYSGHNYGLSVDIDVDGEMKRRKLTKPRLDEYMARRGWQCHRTDGKLGPECWHYNYLPHYAPRGTPRSTAEYLEAHIMALYEPQMRLSVMQCQNALSSLGMYDGALDGIIGPRTNAASAQFARAWGLGEHDTVTHTKLQRVLAFVTATRTAAL